MRTCPDFEFEWVDNPLEVVLDAAADGVSARAPTDPTVRVRMMEGAHNTPVSVTRDDPIGTATTIMCIRDYSQLPVMQGAREVKGIISWKSIGAAHAQGARPDHARDCMDDAEVVDGKMLSFVQITATKAEIDATNEVLRRGWYSREETIGSALNPRCMARTKGCASKDFPSVRVKRAPRGLSQGLSNCPGRPMATRGGYAGHPLPKSPTNLPNLHDLGIVFVRAGVRGRRETAFAGIRCRHSLGHRRAHQRRGAALRSRVGARNHPAGVDGPDSQVFRRPRRGDAARHMDVLPGCGESGRNLWE